MTVEELARVLEAFEPDTEVWIGTSKGQGKTFSVRPATDIRPPCHFGEDEQFLSIMHTEERRA